MQLSLWEETTVERQGMDKIMEKLENIGVKVSVLAAF
jgi:hypothetical protein